MVFKGFLKVIGSFFSLPFLFVKNTFVFLEKIGRDGLQNESSDENIPFLNWLFAAGRVLIVAIAIFILVGTMIVMNQEGILGVFAGVLIAFTWIWLSALWLEMLSLGVVLVNNTKEIIRNTKQKGIVADYEMQNV